MGKLKAARMTVPKSPSAANRITVAKAPLNSSSEERPAEDLPSHAVGATVAGAAIAAAIQNGNGMLYGDAISWLTVAVIAAVLGVFIPRTRMLQNMMGGAFPWALMAGLVYAFYMWPFVRPALYVQQQTPTSQTVYMFGLGSAAILSGLALNSPSWMKRMHLPLLVAVYMLLGVWVLKGSPSPTVDVVVWHREAIAALFHGENPYAITFPNIYPDGSHYPEGLVRDGRVLWGYMYPPINLLMAIPGYLFGDYRYALLIANCVSAVLLAHLRPPGTNPRAVSPFALTLTALFLFTPRALLMLEQGWTEPFLVLFLMLTLWTSAARPKWTPYMLGLLIASKQYVILLMASAYHLPALRQAFNDRKLLLDFAGRTLGTAAAVTLPFFLWSPAAFWHSVVEVPGLHPFREDALSFLAWYKQAHGELLPTSLGFVAAAVASVVAVRWMPNSLAGFAYSVAFIFLFFVAFNRQAFCNYYFLIIAGFYAAAALGQFRTHEATSR